MSQRLWIDNYFSTRLASPHPLQMILRTYALGLSLSLGPSLIPFISSLIRSKPSPRTSLSALKHVLRRDFGLDGFAFAITVCVGGGAAIRRLWHILDSPTQETCSISMRTICRRRQYSTYLQVLKMTSYHRTFLANVLSSSLGVLLLQAGYRRSLLLKRARDSSTFGMLHSDPSTRTIRALPTLDLTLLLFVRAMDAILQTFIHKSTQPAQSMSDKARRHLTEPSTRNKLLKQDVNPDKRVRDLISRTDAFVFWACSAR